MFSTLAAGGPFHTAKIHKIGGFDVGLQGVALFTPPDYEDLQQGPFEGINFVGLPYLQACVGLPLNFEAMGRVFHWSLGDEPTDGGVTLIGAGLKYGLLQKKVLPKVTLMANYTAFFVPEEYSFGTVKTMSIKGIVSHKVLFFEVYGVAGYDRTNLDLDYEPSPGLVLTGNFESNFVHGNIGVTIHPFPGFYCHADYMLSEDMSGFTVGLGLSVR
jgi:hypothetical protein